MDAKEVWPEPPIPPILVEPEPLKEISLFGKSINSNQPQKGNISIREALTGIVSFFNASIVQSIDVKKVRDVHRDARKAAHLYEEANAAVRAYRAQEAHEKVAALLREQIKKKKALIQKLSIAQSHNVPE
ncbi:hypothetical protein NEDG_02053 [Nematocida displodere]|uniref:Uncharacterized protein n=1 Tax=Nematocida displodere TaxID=1805483 RepID=A0A177EMG0_9MICR|nr:hypothetical protein NEDG_02053 [Nematocida displodere]